MTPAEQAGLLRRLAEKRADEALRTRQLADADGHLQWWDAVSDGDVFTYDDVTARRRGWPVSGRVRFLAARWEVLA